MKQKLRTAIQSFFSMCETTGAESILQWPIWALVPDTRGFPKCANGRKDLVENWKCGASGEQARR